MQSNPVLTLIAPSRALVVKDTFDAIDEKRLEVIKNALTNLGWSVREAENLRSLDHRFAGSDAERARALEAILTDGTTDLALALRGGYGASRLLPLLNWNALSDSTVPFAGFSDGTALLLALLAKLGKGGWLAPCANAFDMQCNARDAAFCQAFQSKDFHLTVKATSGAYQNPEAFAAKGLLWGGNLSVLVSLLGTPYFPSVQGGILFLEDVAEPAYRIERAFLQLAYAGVLTSQRAVVLGHFTGSETGAGIGAGHFGLCDAVDFIRRNLKIPVLTGFPIGHVPGCVTIPTGVVGTVALGGGTWTLTADVASILPHCAP